MGDGFRVRITENKADAPMLRVNFIDAAGQLDLILSQAELWDLVTTGTERMDDSTRLELAAELIHTVQGDDDA